MTILKEIQVEPCLARKCHQDFRVRDPPGVEEAVRIRKSREVHSPLPSTFGDIY